MKKKVVTLKEYTNKMNRILENKRWSATTTLTRALNYAGTVTVKATIIKKNKGKAKRCNT